MNNKIFEYKSGYAVSGNGVDLIATLNEYGRDGWEAVKIEKNDISSAQYPLADEYRFILKRGKAKDGE